MCRKTINILLVEDDEVDAEAVIRAFRRQKMENSIIHVVDGIEALATLRGEDGYTALPHPTLILLDLNMPRMGGLEFLETIRGDMWLKRSIVFVLTTSKNEEDKIAAYNYRVAGYILKEKISNNFSEMIQLLEFYQKMVEWPFIHMIE